MQNKVVGTIIVIIVGVAAFYGGMTYATSGTSNAAAVGARGQFGRNSSTTNTTNSFRGARGGAQGGFVAGEIIAKDATSITVKLRDGGSKIILLAPSTQVIKTTAGTVADLIVGTQISTTGNANSDGSVTAQSVRLGAFERAGN